MAKSSCMQAFLRDERGSLTVEFLLWLPLLATWFVISVTAFDAYKSRNDAAKAAYALTDLLTAPNDNQLSNAELQELYALTGKLLPRVGGTIEFRVSSIRYNDPDGDPSTAAYEVQWSDAAGGPQTLQDNQIPLALMPSMAHLDTVLLVELDVPYEPFLDFIGITASEWDFALVSRPRFGTEIAKVD